MDKILETKGWQRAGMDIFWGEIAPCDHILQIYETDDEFITMLERFVTAGIHANEGVIVIATKEHLKALNLRLRKNGLDLFSLTLQDQYIPLPADETLNQFMINGWPDDNLFFHLLTNLLLRARKKDRKVRAFGEMVAVLWSQGYSGATVRLEHLWTRYCELEKFGLLCAYPKSGFTENPHESLAQICDCHSKMVAIQQDDAEQIFVKAR